MELAKGWKNFELHAKKAYAAVNRSLKMILVRAQKEEETCKVLISLVILNRVLVGIWKVKTILMRSQMEMWNMLVETVGKVPLVI